MIVTSNSDTNEHAPKLEPFLAAITTVEGILERTVAGLTQDQPVRRHMDPEGADQIDAYVAKIKDLTELKEPFHVVRILRLSKLHIFLV